MRLRPALIGLVVAAVCATVLAQAPAAPAAFEVASIKANHTGAPEHSSRVQPGGRFVAINMPATSLIASAYGPNGTLLRRNQIEGGPDWMRVDGFDIEAKAPANSGFDAAATSANSPTIQAMLRTLLTERFKLVTHNERRTIPVYALKSIRADGRLGPSIHPVQIDDCAATRTMAAAARQAGPSVWDSRVVCVVAVGGSGILTSYGGTMPQLANVLGLIVDRPVVDATGLQGRFEMNVTYLPPALNPDASDWVSIFTALQEQLGLKLDADKQDIDVLVIDHIEHPTED